MAGDGRMQALRAQIEHKLAAILPPESQAPMVLHRAMRYAVLGEAKRIRPSLAMASSLAAGGTAEDGLSVGCAVELVHCFSLIHDDLPAIDDDDLRRGNPTVHRAFNEAVAVLAGDALFALAFQTLAQAPMTPAAKSRALAVLAEAVGSRGLVGGETMDVEAEGQEPSIELVHQIHTLKTAVLVAASCELGALAACGSDHDCRKLAKFGLHLGLAFQIVDDVLNETSTSETLGKAAGSDRSRRKLTYPACIGTDASREVAMRELETALGHLESLSGDTGPLREIADYCVVRER